MVNLSLGLAYVHYGLKRQSTNRQYLILQGQSFLEKYATLEGQRKDSVGTAESYYNMGRLFQLLGISYLAIRYYNHALDVARKSEAADDVAMITLVNYISALMSVRNSTLALLLLKSNLIL
jgi:general transcription factor 3C polypeptide 3 (transcription factor C subunit 4)